MNHNHTRLYVGDLPETVTQQQLLSLFGQTGQVDSVEVISQPPQPTYAFVAMASTKEARDAISAYNGYEMGDSKLIVYSVPPRSHRRTSE